MGTFTYTVRGERMELLPILTPPETKAVVAAELRGKGLNAIAAALEGVLTNHICGVVAPGQEEVWARTLETDIVGLVKQRYFGREQALAFGTTVVDDADRKLIRGAA